VHPSPKQSLPFMLHTAANLFKREFEQAARPFGMTLLQWRVLGVLSKIEGMTQSTLATLLEARPMTISDVLDRLEGAGLVAREVDPQDSRAKRVTLTDAAQPLIADMRSIALGVYDRALHGIPAGDREILQRSLAQIAANLDAKGPIE